MHNHHNCYGRQLSYTLFHERVPGCHVERSLKEGKVLWETCCGCSLPSAPPPKKGNSQRKHMSRTGWSETSRDLPGGVVLSAPPRSGPTPHPSQPSTEEGKWLTRLGTSEIVSPWTAQIVTNQVKLWIPYNSKNSPFKTLVSIPFCICTLITITHSLFDHDHTINQAIPTETEIFFLMLSHQWKNYQH